MTIADYIKEKREEAGLSMEELAEKAGVSRATIWRAEEKIQPSIRTLIKILKALDCTLQIKNKKQYTHITQ